MSYRALHWAWEMHLPMASKFVIVALADMADEEDSCYPGRKRLAEMVGASPRSVSRALAELEGLGLISRTQRRAPDGFRTSDRYQLHLDKVPICHLPNCQVTTCQGSGANLSEVSCQIGKAIEPPVEPPEEHPEWRASDFELDLPAGTRARRPLPNPFGVTPAMRAWAAAAVPSLSVDAVTAEFVAYWRVGEGSGQGKKNWVLAWRNWLKKEHERNVARGWKPAVEKSTVRGGRVVS